MINTEYLKRVLVDKNVSLEGLAYALGMHRSTLYRKLRDNRLSLEDYVRIKKVLDLTPLEIKNIFGEV